MKTSVVKSELWNALFNCPDECKTSGVEELEQMLNDSMSNGSLVFLDDRVDNKEGESKRKGDTSKDTQQFYER